jgi:hypothetical protein
MLKKINRTIFAVIWGTMSLSGCASLGPKNISPDRISYVEEIGESWKQQMLLNIVKIRYFDPPTFLDVSSVINQYGMENQVNADSRWAWPVGPYLGSSVGIGGYSRYSDKPTITYTPLLGQKFTKNLLTPIPPAAVVSLIQNGWPIDVIFSLTVKSINGVRNGSAGRDSQNGQEDFNKLVRALRTVQLAGISDIRLEVIDNTELIVFVISEEANKELCLDEKQTIRKILKIKNDLSKYKIVFGTIARNDAEIALMTRSMLEIIMEMGATVDVPPEHVAEGWVKEVNPFSGIEQMRTKIHSSREKPKSAFTTVQYQGYWFWIDNTDIYSKRNFALLMIFMSLTESEQKATAPLLTIGQ